MAKYVTISLLYFGHVRYMTNCMATILIAVVREYIYIYISKN